MRETLGFYTILDRVGARGIGDVYRARDTRVGRMVVLTIARSEIVDQPERREQFLRDARSAAALSHPNIAALYEIAEDKGRPYLASEYVPGDTLATLVGGRPVPVRRAIEFGIQLADAVADAHAAGVFNGDLGSGNIIVTPKGRLKILDFGLAPWTRGGAPRENPARREWGRTDIFALGAVLFEMVTGSLPPQASDESELDRDIVDAKVRVSTDSGRIPRELDPIVARALSKKVGDRYESAAILAAELRAVAELLDARTTAKVSEITSPRLAPARSSIIGGVVGIVILTTIAWVVWMAMR